MSPEPPSPAKLLRDAHIVLDAAQAGHPLPQLRWGRWPDRAGWGAASMAAPYAVGCDGRANRARSAAADHTPSGATRHLPRYAEKGSHWPLVSALPAKLWRPEMCASRSSSAGKGAPEGGERRPSFDGLWREMRCGGREATVAIGADVLQADQGAAGDTRERRVPRFPNDLATGGMPIVSAPRNLSTVFFGKGSPTRNGADGRGAGVRRDRHNVRSRR